MRVLYRFWAIFLIAIKRIFSQPWMALATLVGMIFAISLTMSVPLYANAVYNRIFLQEVGTAKAVDFTKTHPPFSFLYTYDSNIIGNLQWENVAPVDQFLKDHAAQTLGLPIRLFAHYYATNPLALFPSDIQQFPDEQKPLLWSSVATISGLEEHVNVIEGAFPKVTADGPIEVMISNDLANDLGIQVGEQYNLFARNQVVNGSRQTLTIPVRIAGVYQALDPESEYWFIRPNLLKERLMVPEEAFSKRISPLLNDEIYGAFWYMLADGSSVRPEMAMSLAARINALQRQSEQVLPKIRLSISPIAALFEYQQAANLLTLLLFAFSIPIFGLLLAFITMTAGMTVERQRNEIAVLRSRGAMIAQMVGIATVESLVLGAVAMAISLPASAWIAEMIGQTRSFLDFSGTNGGSVGLLDNISATTVYFGLGAIVLTMLARLMPTIRAARDNIVMYKRERARSMRAPLWQRIWLDVILMVPAAYGIYLLQQQGSIDPLNAGLRGDPFSNPLLMMVPALAIFAMSLFFLRLLPFFMTAVTWISSRTRSVGVLMAARHLARTPSTYTLPLVLLILTLSLSAFTATLAGTLDHHLHDQIYYKIGSDADFVDLGDSPETNSAPGGPAAAAASANNNTQAAVQPGWFFLPVTDYLKLPGVQDATRVGRYTATVLFGSRYEAGTMLGVDRYNLPNIAFWRPDFARDSLGALMNKLATTPDGVLVPNDFMARNTLNIGDLITIRVVYYQKATEADFHVIGTFDLWPTYYPGEEPMFIANLDYLFEAAGGQYPYDVWLKTDGPVDIKALDRASFSLIGARTIGWQEPASLINAEQSRPERQGLFGVLSVGFGAAALLTVLGFLLYALLSYQRRFVELGVLRAIGLSAGQMTGFLAAELAFLISTGGLIGTVLGVWISNMFIPYLQVGGSDASARIPKYVVYVAWPAITRVYALFGLLFIVALITLIILLRRMRIFAAIKMGESV